MATEFVERRIAEVLVERAGESPVVALQGPRSVGKSTVLAAFARSNGAVVIDLDDLGTRELIEADPAVFVAGSGPVCIDEYQHVPEVLQAIKAELNRRSEPGLFVLTGSSRYDALPRAAQSLTGRLQLLEIMPF